MKSPTLPKPLVSLSRRMRRVAGAYIAYFTAVCASMAAAAAVVTETVPLVVGGF
jgi:hypothetical protein